MAGKVTLETLSLHDLLENRVQGAWDNPDQLALMTPEKQKALKTNPQALDHSLPAQIVALYDGRVIGSIDLVQGLLAKDGFETTILWGSNLFVHPEFRHVAAGIALLMQMQRCHSVVGVVGVSKMVHGVYEGLKWKESPMPRMVLPFKSSQVLRALLKNDTVGTLGSILGDPILALMRARIDTELTSIFQGYEIKSHDIVPDGVQRIIEREPSTLRPKHSVERLDWMLSNSFDCDSTRKKWFVSVEDNDGEIVGYALLRSRFFESASQRDIKNITLATVADWGVDESCGLTESDLVVMAALETRKMGADAVEVPTNSIKLLEDLAKLGFRQMGELSVFLKAAKGSGLDSLGFCEDSPLRPSDGDNFFA